MRVRDPEAIADEMVARSHVPGVTHMFFVDSVFNVPRSHALAVCDAIVARGNPLPWVCYASPVALDEEVVRAMARARCQGVEIGSDSGTPRMLSELKKPFTIDQIEGSHRLFREHAMLDCHTFVLGALDETADEVEETLDFVDRLDPAVAVFIVFMEDRETMTVHRARHRDAILRLLAEEAPKRRGWVVPELGIRFGAKITEIVRRARPERSLVAPSRPHARGSSLIVRSDEKVRPPVRQEPAGAVERSRRTAAACMGSIPANREGSSSPCRQRACTRGHWFLEEVP